MANYQGNKANPRTQLVPEEISTWGEIGTRPSRLRSQRRPIRIPHSNQETERSYQSIRRGHVVLSLHQGPGWKLGRVRITPQKEDLIPFVRMAKTSSLLPSNPHHCFGRGPWRYRIWASMLGLPGSSRLEVRSHIPRRLRLTLAWEIPFEWGL